MASKDQKAGLILGGVVLAAGAGVGMYFLYKKATEKYNGTTSSYSGLGYLPNTEYLSDYNEKRVVKFIKRQNELLAEQQKLRMIGSMR